MAYGWRAQLVLAAMAALTVGSAFGYVQRAHLYEVLDTRPLPPLQRIDYQSATNGENYRLFVQLPPGYDDGHKRYPVMYALDGGAAVELYAENVLPFMRRREIEEAIFVGIDYAGRGGQLLGGSLYDGRRIRDFTVGYNDLLDTTGKGDDFLTFVSEQVIPFVDATYRTNARCRSIGGYGLAARFAVYAMTARPDLFQGCLAIEPGRSFDLNVDTLGAQTDPNESRFYFASTARPGSVEAVALLDAADALSARGYTNVSVLDVGAAASGRYNVIIHSVVEGLRCLYGT